MSDDDFIYPVLRPDLQIAFYTRLHEIKRLYLREALRDTIGLVNIKQLDSQLVNYVGSEYLSKVAVFGVRGELIFPVPIVIEANPYLLGYYRFLFGLSRKDFYDKNSFAKYERLEDQGVIPDEIKGRIPALCNSLISTSKYLFDGIGEISKDIIYDLQLLTIWPQLRGSLLNKIGQKAIGEMYQLIHHIVNDYIVSKNTQSITIINESERTIYIEFFSDPDITVTQILQKGKDHILAIEIKGGKDRSNFYNRFGEAEKSHVKAKNVGFNHLWTIVRIDIDYERLKIKYPVRTTTKFFHLDRIKDYETKEYIEFRELFSSLIGIKTSI